MLHIYCGNGKGKTTCAMGLAVRAAGHGHKVVIAQFLKCDRSGERCVLDALPSVTCLPAPQMVKFVSQMTAQEQTAARAQMTQLFHRAVEESKQADLLVLDELNGALSTGMVDLQEVLTFLDHRAETLEVVITGRDPHPELQQRADYITEMKKIKHPFEQGLDARKGVEW